MTSPENFMISSTLEPLKTSRSLWVLMLASLGIYTFILAYSLSQGRVPDNSTLTYQIVSSLGLLFFLAGIFLPKLLIRKLRKDKPELFIPVDPKESISKELTELVVPPHILRLAFFEATALTGFILGYITINIENFYPCLILSLAGLLYNFPAQRVYRRMLGI